MKSAYLSNKGFSLMEVLVAMILIGIIGVAFSSAVFVANKASTDNNKRLQGLFIAQEIIEDLRATRDSGQFYTTNEVSNHLINPSGLAFTMASPGVYEKTSADVDGRNYQVRLLLTELVENDFLEFVVEVQPQDTSTVRLGTRLYIY